MNQLLCERHQSVVGFEPIVDHVLSHLESGPIAVADSVEYGFDSMAGQVVRLPEDPTVDYVADLIAPIVGLVVLHRVDSTVVHAEDLVEGLAEDLVEGPIVGYVVHHLVGPTAENVVAQSDPIAGFVGEYFDPTVVHVEDLVECPIVGYVVHHLVGPTVVHVEDLVHILVEIPIVGYVAGQIVPTVADFAYDEVKVVAIVVLVLSDAVQTVPIVGFAGEYFDPTVVHVDLVVGPIVVDFGDETAVGSIVGFAVGHAE